MCFFAKNIIFIIKFISDLIIFNFGKTNENIDVFCVSSALANNCQLEKWGIYRIRDNFQEMILIFLDCNYKSGLNS